MFELLNYTFFQHALLGSLFASIACGIIGTYIVTRRLVFISEALPMRLSEVSVSDFIPASLPFCRPPSSPCFRLSV